MLGSNLNKYQPFSPTWSWGSRTRSWQSNRAVWSDAGLILDQRRRRWANIKPALGQLRLFSGSLALTFLWHTLINRSRWIERALMTLSLMFVQPALTSLEVIEACRWDQMLHASYNKDYVQINVRIHNRHRLHCVSSALCTHRVICK